MPNFFSFLSDKISGTKTNDQEYRAARLQMLNTELGINNLKNILRNFNSYTEPLMKYFKSINDSMTRIYKDTPFQHFVSSITYKHELILNEIDNYNKDIAKILTKTSEFDTLFEKAKESQKLREEKRKTFEHYEEKLQKLENDQKKHKNFDLLSRNEEKYRAAAKEYIDISEKSFELIKSSLKLSWDLINQVLGNLITGEKNVFEKISAHYIHFNDVGGNLKGIKEATFAPDSVEDNTYYDPTKYVQCQTLYKKNKGTFVHVFLRKTNSFGKVPEDREKRFVNIKDEFELM